MVPLTGMEADELLPPRHPLPNLDVRLVVNDAMARKLAELNALAYHMPADAFDCIANMRLPKQERNSRYTPINPHDPATTNCPTDGPYYR